MSLTLGYARVLTDGQTLEAQVAQLEAVGARQVFRKKYRAPYVNGRNSRGSWHRSRPAMWYW